MEMIDVRSRRIDRNFLLWSFIALMTTVASCFASAEAQVEPSGAIEIVFVHGRDACREDDIPDAPARAFRDVNGQVHLFATHYYNYAFVGPDFNSLRRNCALTFEGTGNDDPSRFNDRSWLVSFWTADGHDVIALVHNEFQGNLRSNLCPSRKYVECWYNSVTSAISNDGGFHFTQANNPIVAAPLSRFTPHNRRPMGFFGASNIVVLNGYYYVMVWAEADGPQKRGNCLLRTKTPSHPDSWRAWDGSAYQGELQGSPYVEPPPSEPHFCRLIDPNHLKESISSLVFHRPSGRYIALMSIQGGPHPSFAASESSDLLNWTEPQFIMDTGPLSPGKCGNRAERAYPALVDPDSPSRNFDEIGDTAYLYFTTAHPERCDVQLDRDLARIPVRIRLKN